MTRVRISILGGPGSGKSTFIGSLADGLDRRAIDGINRYCLPENASVLRQLTDPLLDGRYPDHTAMSTRTLIDLELDVRVREEVTRVKLDLADFGGEQIQHLFKNRTTSWTDDWQAQREASSYCLFVQLDQMPTSGAATLKRNSPTQPRGEHRHAEQLASDQASQPESVYGPGARHEPDRPPPAHSDGPVLVPKLLDLIEVLQFIRHHRGLDPAERPPPGTQRVAVLFSAWDRFDSTFGPERALREGAPLLADYCWANFQPEDVMAFGLSATGGDLRDESYRKRYLSHPGGFSVREDSRGLLHRGDVAQPLRWLLFGDV
ncbi:MAG: hypothetical protein HY791_22395 [Deltaproteobacteria bacterium]|nr:hypothetical protein [Deltaproteobacteria bacterium]